MNETPKIVQTDKRGQIVIPKEIRDQLNLDENSKLDVYTVGEAGILLKIVKK